MKFGPDHIAFTTYAFPWASVYPHGVLRASDIRDAYVEAGPLEIRTRSGETLFASWDHKAALVQFCERHSIPLVRRLDVWGNLFEPFLDTEFGAEHEAATDARLRAAGLPQPEIDSIRARLAPLMRAYNFDSGLWEWCDLGLYDLLNALNGTLVDRALLPALEDLGEVYRWAMEIADLPQR
ncbi:hypothetical protein ABZ345_44640 [Lentzea sp. NPDC005914]|uniref:hypothetical protein n=1 Tax=Lentzea sp. NPDC005914 TaxID=3154572 RepID=UPI003401E116